MMMRHVAANMTTLVPVSKTRVRITGSSDSRIYIDCRLFAEQEIAEISATKTLEAGGTRAL